MDNALYIGLASQRALRRQMDVLANNIANINTTAFNKGKLTFKEHLMDVRGESISTNGKISTVLDYGLGRNIQEGAIKKTSNPLDIAISGRAYLTVQSPGGDTLYTRNGHLTVNNQGQLSTENGMAVLDDTGQPIFVNPDDTGLEIDATGNISSKLREIGKLGLASFADEQKMAKAGNSSFTSEEAAQPAAKYKIIQGALEQSNVNAVEAMTDMIKVSRSYSSVSKSIGKLNEMRTESLRRLSKVQ